MRRKKKITIMTKIMKIIDWIKNNKSRVINYAVQIIVLLIVIKFFISMVRPVIVIAQYSHPTLDDYWMSLAVYRKWCETHSVLAVISEAFKYTVGIYRTWDGNFLSMFLTSMSPIVFGEAAYPFTFYFMFTTFVLGAAMATYGLLYKRWHMPIINSISIMLLFIIFFMNHLTDAAVIAFWSFYGCSDITKRSFRLAPLVCILMICLIFASFVPIKYTRTQYFGRVLNTNFFVSMMSFTVSIIYLCGALAAWLRSKKYNFYLNCVFAVIALCVIILCRRELRDEKYYNMSIAFRANGAMQFGTAYEYDRMLDERYDELVNSPYWDVYITAHPMYRYFCMTTDCLIWESEIIIKRM